MDLPLEGPTLYTPFLWKGEGPKGGGWRYSSASSTSAPDYRLLTTDYKTTAVKTQTLCSTQGLRGRFRMKEK